MMRRGKGDLYVINYVLFYALKTVGKDYELIELSAKYRTECHSEQKKNV
jgi:hypothetical protein